jgi:7-carboxy-7-deazaguanine synthase
LVPKLEFWKLVDQWNCSPKLANSTQEREERHNTEAISVFKANSCSVDFKFVISTEEDWREVEEDFLKPGLIELNDIILMPEGETQEELSKTREKVALLAIEKGVRFSDRLHITIWNRKVGV